MSSKTTIGNFNYYMNYYIFVRDFKMYNREFTKSLIGTLSLLKILFFFTNTVQGHIFGPKI